MERRSVAIGDQVLYNFIFMNPGSNGGVKVAETLLRLFPNDDPAFIESFMNKIGEDNAYTKTIER